MAETSAESPAPDVCKGGLARSPRPKRFVARWGRGSTGAAAPEKASGDVESGALWVERGGGPGPFGCAFGFEAARPNFAPTEMDHGRSGATAPAPWRPNVPEACRRNKARERPERRSSILAGSRRLRLAQGQPHAEVFFPWQSVASVASPHMRIGFAQSASVCIGSIKLHSSRCATLPFGPQARRLLSSAAGHASATEAFLWGLRVCTRRRGVCELVLESSAS